MSRRAVVLIVIIAVVLLAAVGSLLLVSGSQSAGPCDIGFVRTANGCEATGG